MSIQLGSSTKHLLAAGVIVTAFAACSGGSSLPQGASPSSGTPLKSSSGRTPAYRLVVLGTGLFPNKINNSGTVVGLDLNTNRPFEYKNGRVTDLPLLTGDTAGSAFDINDHDQIVGQTLNPDEVDQYLGFLNPCFGTCPEAHAVLYDHGRISNLGAIPQQPGDRAPVFNAAEAINNNGEIAGESGALNEGNLVAMAFFAPGPVRAVTNNPEFPGVAVEGSPAEINNAGEIVGTHESIFYPVLFAYPNVITCSPPLIVRHNGFDGINNGGDTISGNLDSGGNFVFCQHGVGHQLQLLPSALNDGGDIVGSAPAQAQTLARQSFFKIADMTAGRRTRFARSGISGSRLGRYFISSDRKMGGFVLSVSPGDALLFEKGTYYDLNDLVPNHPGLIFQNPTSINNRGEIIGATVTTDAQTVGWLLVPQ